MEEVSIKGVMYAVERVMSESRYASAVVHGNTIRIRVPKRMSNGEALSAYLDLKRRAIRKIERHGPFIGDAQISFRDGQTVSVLGREFAITVSESHGLKGSSARLGIGGHVDITLASGLDEKARTIHVDALARRVISSAVMDQVQERVRLLNSKSFNFEIKSIRIGKPSSTRWGSCSPKSGRINLSFRLLFAPQIIIDSVIVHELAHLKVANHSDAFWRLVYGAMPNYKEVRKWLNNNGHSIGPGFMADGSELQRLSGACTLEPIVGARAGRA